MKIAIVGGVAGGATTAARLRRVDESAEIIMFERGENISYANCGLPYYVGNVITEREELFLQTPESFYARFRVDVRISSEVLSVDPKKKQLLVKNLLTGDSYTETYDKLVLSPGASPVIPPLPGIKDPAIFTMRNVKDTDAIKKFVAQKKPKRAVVVGAGFIGLEMAENLHHLGLDVSIVEMADQVMTPMDFSLAANIHQHIRCKGVNLFLEEAVTGFNRSAETIEVTLKSGHRLDVDMVILSIGVRPDTILAKEAGIKLDDRGAIRVDEFLQTSEKDIYAVGDAISFPHPITGKWGPMYLAGPANKQGRICADNIVFGNKRKYTGAYGSAIAKVFDLTAGAIGMPAKQLKAEGIDHLMAITHSGDHAGYYPGAIPMTIQIQFSPKDGKVYGAQVVGYQGADKRLDVLGSIIKMGGTIYDLLDFEHAYAPPFNSAKDPINVLGLIADNILSGKQKPIYWYQLSSHKDALVVDVRTADEFALNRIDGAINIPVDELRDRVSELPKSKKIIIYCSVGIRGYVAVRQLMQIGYKEVYNLIGGIKTYSVSSEIQSSNYDAPKIERKEGTVACCCDDDLAEVKHLRVDACGIQCPGPILRLKKSVDGMKQGEHLSITATDQGFRSDVKAWCESTGNRLHSIEESKGVISAEIEKGTTTPVAGSPKSEIVSKNKTMVVFSDDFDKAIASMIIANGAASIGGDVTLFFTFWGLNVLKRANKPKVKKTFIEKMFSMMMPKNLDSLPLSKMNMMGMGPKMIKNRMKVHNVDSLNTLMNAAIESGVHFVACQMSMDLMGIKPEELIDGVEIGGVASYMNKAEQSSVNLFI